MNISKINSVNTYFKQRYQSNPIHSDNEGQIQSGYNVQHKFNAINRGTTNYSSKTGDYDVAVKGFLPIIKRRELYYPSKEVEVVIRRTPDGIKKVTKTPTATVTQMFEKSAILKQDKDFSILDKGTLDYQNGEVSRLTETSLGSKYLLRYDKALKRRIYIEEKPEGRIATITDIRTGEQITSGDRIYDTYYNNDGDEIIENLLTGKIVQLTKYFDKSRKIQHQTAYYENSTNPKFIYDYNSSTNEATTRHFDEAGNVTRLEIDHIPYKSIEIYTYDEKGNTISHKEGIKGFSLGAKKPIVCEIIYNPENNDIDKIIDKKGNSTTIVQYSSSKKDYENNPVSIEYLKDKKLYKFEQLQNGGENTKYSVEFNGLNEVCYTKYDKDGYLEQVNYFDKDGNLAVSLDYIPVSGKLASVTKYKPENKGYKQYVYSNYSKYPINIIKVDDNNQIKKITLNLDSNNNPKNLSSTYFANGSFDMEWQGKTADEKTTLPHLPKNRSEVLTLVSSLSKKSQQALIIRQNNFRRLG